MKPVANSPYCNHRFLKEKKKLKKKGGTAEPEYGTDGWLDQESFRPTERVHLHETNAAPPDLKKLGKELAKRAKAKKDYTAKPSSTRSLEASEEDADAKKKRLEKIRAEAQAAYKELKKARRA